MATEAMTETPTTPTEGTTSSEAAAATLLASTEAEATTQQQQGEQQQEGDKPAEGENPAVEAKVAEGAPESYDFKAPEGSTYDPAVLEPFSAAAKEANLTQDAAQKLLDKMAPALADRQQNQVKEVQAGWLESSKTDKEFGGDKLQENLAVAKKAYDTFATPELKSLLEQTGLGNHPEVIRLMVKVGKGMSEDGFVTGSAKTESGDRAKRLYDKTN